ncbi:activity-regulated cytoskeleton associated protein 2 [Musca vetustissima]|uniref:activity-regulated cytoskeleton associated protein 2 n=1 Tax=Musca vetustissima TaxID=27455 RepID=UPI002AB6DD05|nr:activity-regulated cytoskeleton associated protein 2 [Musca vetustissima]
MASQATQMSPDQFQQLIETIKSLAPQQKDQVLEEIKSKGSFANCCTRFAGQCDNDAVEVFIDAVETYKEMEQISDKDALRGLPLLFNGLASTWWKGVRREAKTWDDAMRLLREHFSPSKPTYQIYLEIFEKKQGDLELIDPFILEKRALLAKLPEGRHDEETELDFVYGLLNVKYRQKIPRHEIKSFRELLEKGRTVERTRH